MDLSPSIQFVYSPPAVTGNISLWEAVSPRSIGNHQNNGSKLFHCLLPNQTSVLYWDPSLTILLKKTSISNNGNPILYAVFIMPHPANPSLHKPFPHLSIYLQPRSDSLGKRQKEHRHNNQRFEGILTAGTSAPSTHRV